MKNCIYIIVVIVICLIVITYNLFKVHVYEFVSPSFRQGDPIICLIGSVHGNEPAGTLALEELIRSKWFDNIINSKIIVILNPNPIGLLTKTREAWNWGWYDINRSYISNEESSIVRQIKKYVHQSDLVLEFHEGWGFHKVQPSSLGSTIMPTQHNLAVSVAKNMLLNINNSVSDKDKHFTLITNDSCGIISSLGCYCETNNVPHILLEITGQNNKQPIEIRKKQVKLLIGYTMQHMHII